MLKKIFAIGIILLFCTRTLAQDTAKKQEFLLFWKSDCSACHTAIPQMVKKIETLDKNKFIIRAVSFDTDSVSYFKSIKDLKMENFIHQYNFRAGYNNNVLAKRYHVTKTPTLIYLDRNGNAIAEGNDAFKILSGLKK